ncbi:alpha/beta hydrolase fold domain-containing protein [Aquimarina brevivitae]|uniref:Acetyl esterase/lipase n=1 Tax=Aquimarina brevivitae TaxID=323412 RepID=A0A4Q7P545_9FLAO|nr:alpha/beta hydrolase fold domain-containing protein [Aquimarina brevivitae]RZS93832.1 acetyl esterase/lipase [Aquimarina brevivitae]
MSFRYSILKFFLKVAGEKKSWSKDPIDFHKKRKDNRPEPSKKALRGIIPQQFQVLDSKITALQPKNNDSEYLLFYCHGGAFIYGPTEHQWNSVCKIVKETQTNCWVVDYPKAPENKIISIQENICKAYEEAVKQYDPSKIILMGDSVGGNLVTTLVQGLIKEKVEVPNHLLLITPLMDASLSNPRIKDIDPIDPILSYQGVRSAKQMCAGDTSLTDPLISPLYGTFAAFPKIYLFMATNDILMPDQEIFIQKVTDSAGEIEVIKGEGMPHIWPFLPFIPEGKRALQQIISIIKAIKA